MCGIVGYIGDKIAEDILVEGLSKLEYRGYDSAGIATIVEGDTIRRRQVGKLIQLRNELANSPCPGTIGIGHTRWATHGAPTQDNAHPHHHAGITVVHNGIIENHHSLREELREKGHTFSSETDTEIIAHLIGRYRGEGQDMLTALRTTLGRVEGAYAIAVLDQLDDSRIAFARKASPLIVGIGQSENFLASDIPAVLSHTRSFVFLEDGDHGFIHHGKVEIYDEHENAVERPIKTVDWSPVMAEKGGHKHFMHKEIYEQPRAIADTLRGRIQPGTLETTLSEINTEILNSIERIIVVACGTSYHAGMTGRYVIEKMARLPVQVELASEFRYRDPILNDKTLVLAISQSGETADTLAALKEAIEKGAPIMAISNVIDSAIPRLCEPSGGTLYTRAGPEIGVASTKAFTTQLVALNLLAIELASVRKTCSDKTIETAIDALTRLPREIENLLDLEDDIKAVAREYVKADNMLYLGRGSMFPIALEGALKLKEISYIHAEGYAAGEMKHGPIALIDENMPVVVIATPGLGYEKVVANLEEVKARGGKIIGVGHESDAHLKSLSEQMMPINGSEDSVSTVLASVPLQLFSYHIADLRGTDVDQPRNLAKSVTVE